VLCTEEWSLIDGPADQLFNAAHFLFLLLYCWAPFLLLFATIHIPFSNTVFLKHHILCSIFSWHTMLFSLYLHEWFWRVAILARSNNRIHGSGMKGLTAEVGW